MQNSNDAGGAAGAAAGAAVGLVFVVIYLAFIVLMIASAWRVFTKAGQPGWAAIIPFFNVYIMLKIAGKPAWWLVLMLIPCVNIVVWIIMVVALAKSFGKDVGFAIGMILLSFIFWPILAFGDAKYIGTPSS